MVGAGARDPRESARVRDAAFGFQVGAGGVVVVVGASHWPTLVALASRMFPAPPEFGLSLISKD
jgi:hypothetical protein